MRSGVCPVVPYSVRYPKNLNLPSAVITSPRCNRRHPLGSSSSLISFAEFSAPDCSASSSIQLPASAKMVLSSDIDLLHPPKEVEQSKHKLKRLVQSPNSYFMDVKCQGCFNITTVFSHSQTVVTCTNCSTILCTPTGGKARLTEGCSFRRKGD
ncbi:hypothetical protein ABBQ38_001828 [Trebouxia sp. C0009 RCD-2024]